MQGSWRSAAAMQGSSRSATAMQGSSLSTLTLLYSDSSSSDPGCPKNKAHPNPFNQNVARFHGRFDGNPHWAQHCPRRKDSVQLLFNVAFHYIKPWRHSCQEGLSSWGGVTAMLSKSATYRAINLQVPTQPHVLCRFTHRNTFKSKHLEKETWFWEAHNSSKRFAERKDSSPSLREFQFRDSQPWPPVSTEPSLAAAFERRRRSALRSVHTSHSKYFFLTNMSWVDGMEGAQTFANNM